MPGPAYSNDRLRAPRTRLVLAAALAAGSIFAITASAADGATAVHKRTLPTPFPKWVKRAHPHRSHSGQIIFRPAVG